MVQFVDSKGDPYVGLRRHRDPPNLWLNVLTGSILLHALAILSVRMSAVPPSPPSTQAVPVDLIDIPATVTASKSIRNPRTANKQSATGTLQPQNIATVRRYIRTPTPSSSLVPFTRSPQQSTLQNGRRTPAPDGIRRSRPASSPNPSTTPPPSSGHPGSTTTRPSPSPTKSPQGPRPTSPSTPDSPSESQGGKGLAMTFANWSQSNGGTDQPDPGHEAKPIDAHPLFPDRHYTAHERKSLGKVMSLRLNISDDGSVSVVPKPPGWSGDAGYLMLVQDLFPLKFHPALQGGKPVPSYRYVDVRLDPIKQK